MTMILLMKLLPEEDLLGMGVPAIQIRRVDDVLEDCKDLKVNY